MWSLRRVSSVFIGLKGIHVHKNIGQTGDEKAKIQGSDFAHALMRVAQLAAYCFEGSVNKMIVDDKGVLILILFGLAPLHHVDDALRACFCAQRVSTTIQSLLDSYGTSHLRRDGIYDDRSDRIPVGIGVATGTVWCGTVGTEFRCEYTALGDPVNLSARLMAKAMTDKQIIERSLTRSGVVLCDKKTKEACERVFTFKAHPPVQLKGKKEKTPMFEPRPNMMDESITRTTYEDPIRTYPKWKYRKRIMRVLAPRYKYRTPIIGLDDATPDYPVEMPGGVGEKRLHRFHPQYPWEIVEPWSPSLLNIGEAGGVMVIKGGEHEGTTELAETIKSLGEHHLGFNVFSCSNMPLSTDCNISSVPLLAWRSLCNDIIQRWRVCGGRLNRGYHSSSESTLSYVKELLHPAYHWRVNELVGIIENLEVDDEYLMDTTSDEDAWRMSTSSSETMASMNSVDSVESIANWHGGEELSGHREPLDSLFVVDELKGPLDNSCFETVRGGRRRSVPGSTRGGPSNDIKRKHSHRTLRKKKSSIYYGDGDQTEPFKPSELTASSKKAATTGNINDIKTKTPLPSFHQPGLFVNSVPTALIEETASRSRETAKSSKLHRISNRRPSVISHHTNKNKLHIVDEQKSSPQLIPIPTSVNLTETESLDTEPGNGFNIEMKPKRPTRRIHHYAHYRNQDARSKAPLVASIANGYSLHEPTIILWHVRKGSSVYVNVDEDSWESARFLAQIAYDRRRRKIEHDHRALKKWRREHSRRCDYCKGIVQPYLTVDTKLVLPNPTKNCKPPSSDFFPPLIFIFICDDNSHSHDTQNMIVQWARQCGAFIPLKPMSMIETSSYLGSCLQAPRQKIPPEIIRFVYRVTMGIPRYISNTAARLVQMEALTLRATRNRSQLVKERILTRFEQFRRDNNAIGGAFENHTARSMSEENVDVEPSEVVVDRNPELGDFIQDCWKHDSLFKSEDCNADRLTSEEDSDRVNASSDDLLLEGDDIDSVHNESLFEDEFANQSDKQGDGDGEDEGDSTAENLMIPTMGPVSTVMCTHKLRTINILEFNERKINQPIVRSFPVDVRRRGMFLRNGRIVFHEVNPTLDESAEAKKKNRRQTVTEKFENSVATLHIDNQVPLCDPRQRSVLSLVVSSDMCVGPSAHRPGDPAVVKRITTDLIVDPDDDDSNTIKHDKARRRRRNSVLPGKRSSVASIPPGGQGPNDRALPGINIQPAHSAGISLSPDNSMSLPMDHRSADEDAARGGGFKRKRKLSIAVKNKFHRGRTSEVTTTDHNSYVDEGEMEEVEVAVADNRAPDFNMSLDGNNLSSESATRIQSSMSSFFQLKFLEVADVNEEAIVIDRGGGSEDDESDVRWLGRNENHSKIRPRNSTAHSKLNSFRIDERSPSTVLGGAHTLNDHLGTEFEQRVRRGSDGKTQGRMRRVSVLIKHGIKGLSATPTHSHTSMHPGTPCFDGGAANGGNTSRQIVTRRDVARSESDDGSNESSSYINKSNLNRSTYHPSHRGSVVSSRDEFLAMRDGCDDGGVRQNNNLRAVHIIPHHLYPHLSQPSVDKRIYKNEFRLNEWMVVGEDVVNAKSMLPRRDSKSNDPPWPDNSSHSPKWYVFRRSDLPNSGAVPWPSRKKQRVNTLSGHTGMCRLSDDYDALISKCPGPENWLRHKSRAQFRPVIAETYTEYPSIDIHVSALEPEVIKTLNNYRVRELARRGRMNDETKNDSSSSDPEQGYHYADETENEARIRKGEFTKDKIFHLRLKTLEQIKHDHPLIEFHIEYDNFRMMSLPLKPGEERDELAEMLVMGNPDDPQWEWVMSRRAQQGRSVPTRVMHSFETTDFGSPHHQIKRKVAAVDTGVDELLDLFKHERMNIDELYINDLRSQALRTVESLSVEEQEVAMVASAFPVAFTEQELLALIISVLPKMNGTEPIDIKDMLQRHIKICTKKDLIEVFLHAPDDDEAYLLREYIIKKSRYIRSRVKEGTKSPSNNEADSQWSPRITMERLLDHHDNQLFKVVELDKLAAHRSLYSQQSESVDGKDNKDRFNAFSPRQSQVNRGGHKRLPKVKNQGIVYFRFKSVAMQHFINVMMLSGKRSRCARIALKILSYRYSSRDRLTEHIARELWTRIKLSKREGDASVRVDGPSGYPTEAS
eukprot:GHVH01007843.1.p1 GENE.GHVH01007843.1~~GHVH01007843.1.p1  ORF type:complete len:2145 (-),score=290.17 GHVH01007843.1:74-6508(-)